VAVKASVSGIAHLALGGLHTCALSIVGSLQCWGYNNVGQVGNGSKDDALVPFQIATQILQVSAQENHTCAVKSENNGDANVYCWGGGIPLGDGSLGQISPTFIPIPGATKIVEVQQGGLFTCARDDTSLFCWGMNFAGQIGIGTFSKQFDTPQKLGFPGNAAIALGQSHASANVAGNLYMWGEDANGALGDGASDMPDASTTANQNKPEKIGLSNIQSASLGEEFSCALTTDGQVLCWGLNDHGQCGDGTTASKFTPTPVVWPQPNQQASN
jgi:alpha-tubulin suppressor-like RCC1 family protein